MLPLAFAPHLDVNSAITPVIAAEQASPPPRPHDPLFPGHGHVSSSVATGIPFLAMGEVAVGIGDRFTFAAIGGATPNVPGFGIRPRVSVIESGAWRAVLATPILYYPFTDARGGAPWFLTRPSLVVEHAFSNGVRVGAGMGVVVAASVDRLTGRERPVGYTGGLESGLWNTLNASVSVPVAQKASVFAEGALVMSGVRIAGDDWVGGPPFTVALGVATSLF